MSSGTMAEPMNPVAPVRKIRMVNPPLLPLRTLLVVRDSLDRCLLAYDRPHSRPVLVTRWDIWGIRSILRVRSFGPIVRRLHGPTLRCLVVAETAELCLGRLRGGWRDGHPISKTSSHQVLCHLHWPMLAVSGSCA